jgi:hypothetical protein
MTALHLSVLGVAAVGGDAGRDDNVLVGMLFFGSVLLVNGSLSAGCLLKGKMVIGCATFAIGGPFVNGLCLCRLAKPDSWWARRYYGPAKLARARSRYARRARAASVLTRR